MGKPASKLQQKSRVLLIEREDFVCNLVSNYFQSNDAGQVEVCSSAIEGLRLLSESRFDFIVMDWKQDQVSGLALLNRIRSVAGYGTTPILITSGQIKKQDFRLLQEFPCTGLLEKPFSNVKLDTKIKELDTENLWYFQNDALIESLLNAVSGDNRKLEKLIKEVLKKAPNPIPLAIHSAKILLEKRLLASAERILVSVLKTDPDCVMAMNELGKVLHLAGNHDKAIAVLEKAHSYSPDNVTRLCLMGEVDLSRLDAGKARRAFRDALKLDPDNEKANAGVSLSDNLEILLKENKAIQVPNNFSSLLNTIGITFVRTGRFERGIKQYQAAMTFLDNDGDCARVAFNAGLGYVRWGKLDESLAWFEKSKQMGGDDFTRADELIAKVQKLAARPVAKKASNVIRIKSTQSGVQAFPHVDDGAIVTDEQDILGLSEELEAKRPEISGSAEMIFSPEEPDISESPVEAAVAADDVQEFTPEDAAETYSEEDYDEECEAAFDDEDDDFDDFADEDEEADEIEDDDESTGFKVAS